MWDWYDRFYEAAPRSQSHHLFCEQVYGLDLCQHGFADVSQLSRLIGSTGIGAADRVLDLGCGTGLIARYVARQTGASVHGIDYSPRAIALARQRAAGSALPLTFAVGNLDAISPPDVPYDVVLALDTLYLGDLTATIFGIRASLVPGGRLGASYSIALRDHPGSPPEILEPDHTPLAIGLNAAGMPYLWWDVTAEDLTHARRRLVVLAELETRFADEGNGFLYDNRIGEARGCVAAIDAGAHRRYLYIAHRDVA
jgi:2-polyprenyl-3-methyl-5-hydroxy-6-metoxy-1,4-benzoquinol methylase